MSAQIILQYFYDQAKRKKTSLRSLAEDIGVSHAFLSKVIKGKANVPKDRVRDFIRVFKMDEVRERQFKRALKLEAPQKQISTDPKLEAFREKDSQSWLALQNWYEIPLMDLLTCELVSRDPAYLAKRLDITEQECLLALRRLKSIGLVEEHSDPQSAQSQWQKLDKNLRFPTRKAHAMIKEYYKKILKKNLQTYSQLGEDSFDYRLLVNLSIALDPEKIPVLKQRLHEVMYAFAEEFAAGPSSEVYFLTTSFLPVTKPDKK